MSKITDEMARNQQVTKRGELIAALRHALYLAESPKETVVEFEIGDTGFCFDFAERKGD